MKAVFFEKYGGLEVLKYGEFPTPKPQKGEALVRVRACGLNHLDIWLRNGASKVSLPHIVGSDVSGVIAELNGKTNFKIGDEVVINPELACGTCERCQKGKSCGMVNLLARQTNGGYAEYICVALEQVYPKPKKLSFVESAAFPLTFLTAWHALHTRAFLEKDEIVFVWGASGSLGPAVIQISKYFGAKVIAAVRSEEIGKMVTSLGADEIILYPKENVSEQVKELTSGKGVDVVFESVGEKTFSQSMAMLKPYGRVVVVGATSGEKISFNLSDFYPKQFSIIGSRMGSKEEFEDVLKLINAGTLKPVIDQVFPLSRAADAQRRMEESKHTGKIVLEVP
ncbi:MAG TPA: zinc-binding dehydrogenase [Candidatus Nanoarchaeia archaeon]|nr:zinc-binding dehydrogenase [Candidatus Nanoarchaeia archaeon]